MSRGSSVELKKEGMFNSAVHVVTGKVYVFWGEIHELQWDGLRPEFHLSPGLHYPHFDW